MHTPGMWEGTGVPEKTYADVGEHANTTQTMALAAMFFLIDVIMK